MSQTSNWHGPAIFKEIFSTSCTEDLGKLYKRLADQIHCDTRWKETVHNIELNATFRTPSSFLLFCTFHLLPKVSANIFCSSYQVFFVECDSARCVGMYSNNCQKFGINLSLLLLRYGTEWAEFLTKK